jgi:peptidoglycan/xylan/chitin deacetylase (PgdA/CDA1 family)
VKNVWSFLMLSLVLSIALGCSATPSGDQTEPPPSAVVLSSSAATPAPSKLDQPVQSEASPAPSMESKPSSLTTPLPGTAAARPVDTVDKTSVSAQVYMDHIGVSNIASVAVPTVSPAKKPGFRIPVLNYHSVSIDPGNVVVISPAKLEEQMQYLADNSYDVLTLQQFIDIWQGKAEAPPKPVLLTFDDGYTDNYTEAMPILKKFNFPATLFMTPGWVDKDGYLTWEQVEEMHSNGWDIQPHGMSHTSLSKLDKEKQLYEITEARKQIEERFDTAANVFCYPYGHYNQTTLSILKEQDFLLAFTIEQGRTDRTQDPYLLRRLFINGEEDLKMFITKLEKWK